MRFGEVLKGLRAGQNLTQSEFAKIIGVSRSTIGMYEQGKREPDFETMERVADYFNVPLETFTGKNVTATFKINNPSRKIESKKLVNSIVDIFEKYMPQISDLELEIIDAFRAADLGTKAAVCKLLDVEIESP